MGSNPSVNPQIQEPKKWPQLLALVMAIFAFLFFGGGYYLNQKYLKEEASAFAPRVPVAGQKIWTTGQGHFRFEWTGHTGEDDLLEVARDADFRDLVLDTPSPRSPMTTDKIPGEGDYYYRIIRRTEADSIVVLPAVKFTIVTKTPPQLIYPFGAMNSQEGKVMRFYWQAKHGVTKYRFQVSFDKNFQNMLSDFVVDETQTTPQNLPVGEFHWRVRGEEDAQNFTQWTEPRRLTIEKPGSLATNTPPPPPPAVAQPPVAAFVAPPPPAPAASEKTVKPDPKAPAVPAIVKNSQKLVLKYKSGGKGRNIASENAKASNPPALVWNKIKGTKTYDVQVSSKADFSKLEWSQSIAKNQAYWDSVRPGRYYWRVRANGNNGAKSEFSSAASIEVSLPAPTLKKTLTHSVKVKNRADLSNPTAVPLTWNNVPGAAAYKVIVADNESFLPVKVDIKVDRNNAKVSLVDGGSYFVKVAALNADGEAVSEFSKISTLKFDKRAPAAAASAPAPMKASKKAQATPEPRVAEPPPAPKAELAMPRPKLPPNGVSLVSLNGTQDPILFKWEAVDKAETYRLEISSDEDFKSITHSTTTRENQVVITKLLPKGRNFWRVRAEQGTSKSDWSQAFSIEK